jgi:trigger factor
MKTEVEQESPTRLKLVIEVEPDELKPIYEQTVKRLAREVNIPGFRKGKVPRAVLESRVGEDHIKDEFLKDALPALYMKAAGDEKIRPITFPELEVDHYHPGEPLTFTATVEVRPEVNLPEYKGIEVERPSTQPTDEEIEEQFSRLREQFGTLEPVGRNATEGDHVTIDLHAYRHDQKIDEASAEDLLYEVGSGSLVPELDKEVEGKRAGDIIKFNAVLPARFQQGGEEVSFSVIVKEVQAKRLPELDDEFAKTASEFDTLEELRSEILKRLEAIKGLEADSQVRTSVLEDLVDRANVPLPESAVEGETGSRLNHLVADLEQAGLTFDQYLEATKTTREELLNIYRQAAEKAVAADLILEAVAGAEDIDVSQKEIDEEIQNLSKRMEVEEDRLRKDLQESGRVQVLAGDILRRKALDFLVDQAKVSPSS